MTELPGLFDDAFDATDAVWDNYELIAPDYQRVHVYGVWFNSPAVIATTETPVTSLEDLAGMRLEGQDVERGAEAVGVVARGRDHRLVAQVDAVEVADGGHRAARLRRQTLAMPVDRHGVSAN